MENKKGKIVQDPVHGCILVGENFVNILNSVQFQRLKHVSQSSFRVLYPGATHDRFIHSLGTYHLAQKAIQNFFKNIKEDIQEQTEDINKSQQILENTFLYAALLHDIGHAPFSHTCEDYFAKKDSCKDNIKQIHADLIGAIKELNIHEIIPEKAYMEFETEYKKCLEEKNKKDAKNRVPSPHEIISATMLVKERETLWKNKEEKIDFELAARMVIGLKYLSFDHGNMERENYKKLGNCLIRLLNSPCLDVDKLDYICRDTKMTGFSNVQLDIDRITMAFTAVKHDGSFELAFRKNMLSVIDNVFRAKIEQGMWLISHPSVVYENNLIQRCISLIEKIETSQMFDYVENIFSYSALTEEGIEYRDKHYRLLSDIDILSDFKHFLHVKDNQVIDEFFDRGKRRKPLWKSYKEYLYFFHDSECNIEEKPSKVYKYFEGLIEYLDEKKEVLNHEVYSRIEKERPDLKEPATLLKNLCKESNVEFNMVLVKVKNDFANKISTEDVYIKFKGQGEDALIPYDLLEKHEEKKSIPFFYLYNRQPLERDWFREHVLKAVNDN